MTRDFKSANWDENMLRLHHVIRGRFDIQVAAHDLLQRIKTRQATAPDSEYSNKYEILVAITFSLWRAVFLADGLADQDKVVADAEKFLEKVLRDNRVTYGDDWNNRALSFAYYLGNANYRLKELTDTWREFRTQLTPGDFAFLSSSVGGISAISALELWRGHCYLLQLAIWRLKDGPLGV